MLKSLGLRSGISISRLTTSTDQLSRSAELSRLNIAYVY